MISWRYTIYSFAIGEPQCLRVDVKDEKMQCLKYYHIEILVDLFKFGCCMTNINKKIKERTRNDIDSRCYIRSDDAQRLAWLWVDHTNVGGSNMVVTS